MVQRRKKSPPPVARRVEKIKKHKSKFNPELSEKMRKLGKRRMREFEELKRQAEERRNADTAVRNERLARPTAGAHESRREKGKRSLEEEEEWEEQGRKRRKTGEDDDGVVRRRSSMASIFGDEPECEAESEVKDGEVVGKEGSQLDVQPNEEAPIHAMDKQDVEPQEQERFLEDVIDMANAAGQGHAAKPTDKNVEPASEPAETLYAGAWTVDDGVGWCGASRQLEVEPAAAQSEKKKYVGAWSVDNSVGWCGASRQSC
jgi:hypothetical protein